MRVGKFEIEGVEQYSQLARRNRCLDYSVLRVSGDNDDLLGRFEVTLIVAGLGLRLAWHHTETDFMQRLMGNVR